MSAAASAGSLAIAGLTRLSSCDWPDHLVATVFLQGCPWRCTYCHNSDILDPRTPGTVPWSEVLDLLRRRGGLLDGVMFSGGEPTMQAGLVDACRQVRELGFAVGLHTGGAYPARLRELVPLLDWVGFDLKAPSAKYRRIVRVGGPSVASDRARESLRLLLDAGVPLQVRTTVDPTVLDEVDLAELDAELAGLGAPELVRQSVRPDGTTPEYRAALARSRVGGPVVAER